MNEIRRFALRIVLRKEYYEVELVVPDYYSYEDVENAISSVNCIARSTHTMKRKRYGTSLKC
jgi:hypothetical protein